jgi:hypothetical protein
MLVAPPSSGARSTRPRRAPEASIARATAELEVPKSIAQQTALAVTGEGKGAFLIFR